MPALRTYKQRPTYLQPVHQAKEYPRFEPIPVPRPAVTSLSLSSILGEEAVNSIRASGQLAFHCLGDTGGVNGADVEENISAAMEAQYTQTSQAGGAPQFMYHLGDVIYFNGQSYLYNAQFYDPYKYYPGSIFAIPGNHDGDTHVGPNDPPDQEPSLHGFLLNFCAADQQHKFDAYRPTMTEPYPYWTLTAPFITIIGLYGNIDGNLDPAGTAEQQDWLTQQLRAADPQAALIVAVHQPPYSLDTSHGGYPLILDALDQASQAAGRWPNVVLSGHVHNYQRFTRSLTVNGQASQIPYIIAGAGGYANKPSLIHKMNRDPDNPGNPVPCPVETAEPDVSLRGYNEIAGGFLRVTVTSGSQLTLEYFAVPFGDGSVSPQLFDAVTVDCSTRQVVSEMNPGISGAHS